MRRVNLLRVNVLAEPMKILFVAGAIILGFALLIFSSVWVSLLRGRSPWTPEKAERWAEVKDRLHNLSFVVNAPAQRLSMHGGPELGEAKAEYVQLKKESQQLKAEFQSAYDRPRTTAAILKWSGVSLVGLGLLGWLATKDS